MPRAETNDERAEFMARHGLMAAAWDEEGTLISATRSPTAARPQQAPSQPGPAAKIADAFANRMKRDIDVRFAATHYRPRVDAPANAPVDDVPRAVRAREAQRGRSPSNKQNR